MSFTDLQVKELQGSILPSSFSEAKNTVLTLISENEGITDAVVGQLSKPVFSQQPSYLLSGFAESRGLWAVCRCGAESFS